MSFSSSSSPPTVDLPTPPPLSFSSPDEKKHHILQTLKSIGCLDDNEPIRPSCPPKDKMGKFDTETITTTILHTLEACGAYDSTFLLIQPDSIPFAFQCFHQLHPSCPPKGDQRTSNFNDNTIGPIWPMQFGAIAPHLQDFAQSLFEELKSTSTPQDLWTMVYGPTGVKRRDIARLFATHNPSLSAKWLQQGNNPTNIANITFTPEELNQIKMHVAKHQIENWLVQLYLFEPFQSICYSVNFESKPGPKW